MTRKAYFAAVAAFLLLGWFAVYTVFSSSAAAIFLTLEMASSTPSVAQLFFDKGNGFREEDSRTAYSSSDSLSSFKRLIFELPGHATYRALRFDPLTTAGSFAIRNVSISSGNALLLSIPPEDVLPFNQIGARVQRGSEIQFSTTPDANDPGLSLRLRQPLKSPSRFSRVSKNWLFWAAIVAVLMVAIVLGFSRSWLLRAAASSTPYWARANDFFANWARRISNDEALCVDAAAVWVGAVCVALFFIGVALNLNGSSAGVYPALYHHGAAANIWLGYPKPNRVDEWAYVTPDILNQALRKDRFGTVTSALGGHSVALTGNIPIWHFSTLFRPQYWAFFVLPVDYAFAFYWQSKALILVLGIFAWLLLITRSTFWSLTGSLWYFFSPLTQWAYSWASALPEMIGSVLLVTVMACCLTVERRRRAILVESLVLAACAVNFALCAYVPHMVPLFWTAAFFFLAWCIAKRAVIFQAGAVGARLAAFALVMAVVGAVGLAVFVEVRVAIAGIVHTVYPGHRSLSGGNTIWPLLIAGFVPWTLKETGVPAALGNVCEASSFLWLAPLALALVWRLKLQAFQKALLVALWLASALILAWLLLPIPADVGRIMGLDRTFGQRLVPALGLANIGITVLCAQTLPAMSSRARAIFTALGVSLLVWALYAANKRLDHFFHKQDLLIGASLSGLLIYLFLARRKWAFAALLILPQALVFGRVNPVERGLPAYLDSDLRKFVSENPSLLKGKWLMFSDAVVNSGFLAATGAEVYDGMRYLPDVDNFPVFAANHLDLNNLDRSAYFEAHLRTAKEPMNLEIPSPAIVQWDVRPGDPILKQIGIQFVASDRLPDDQALAFLEPLSSKPIDGYWLYRLR